MAVFGSWAGVPVLMRVTTGIRVVISLISMVCFALPMLLTSDRLTVALRFALPMLHAVAIPTLL
jgi:hypothetical protein